ncbi:MAG: YHS domain-containing protein [Dehalococcoidia bacterium]
MFTSSINVEGLQALIGGKDPVCGKDVQSSTAAATINRDNKTFHFCSTECKSTFDADPGKYGGSS